VVQQPLNVDRCKVGPPVCISCTKARWPAWKSKKNRWHCGFCHRPDGGRPRCLNCSELTWDGWPGPMSHDRVWWCRTCWCTQREHGKKEWEDWFDRRLKEFPEEFADCGPLLEPAQARRKPKTNLLENRGSYSQQ
ncbi:unnamed protein product, partial [Polarella glacialis]